MTTEDLANLVERAQEGDRAALEAVLGAVQHDIYRLALRMTAGREDAMDATQEILVKVLTRLSTFRGHAAFTTWVHRVAVNHLLDRKRSAVERHEMSFDAFADDLRTGLEASRSSSPEAEVLAREVKHGCTLALLTCLDREARVAYVLGEVFGVSSRDGAWICEISEPAYRQRLSRARSAVRDFLTAHCGLVAPTTARCHCRRRVAIAVKLGRVDPALAATPTVADVQAAVDEMERLYDTAALLRSVPDARAPDEVAVHIRGLVAPGRYGLLTDPTEA
jgi:RNA polymerase sigma factor (sigma-70 family)